jgi:hypothetical protein
MSEALTFVYVLRLVKPESQVRISSHGVTIVEEHFEHLKKALTEGKLEGTNT